MDVAELSGVAVADVVDVVERIVVGEVVVRAPAVGVQRSLFVGKAGLVTQLGMEQRDSTIQGQERLGWS